MGLILHHGGKRHNRGECHVRSGLIASYACILHRYVCSDALMVSLCLYFDFIYVRKKPSPGEVYRSDFLSFPLLGIGCLSGAYHPSLV